MSSQKLFTINQRVRQSKGLTLSEYKVSPAHQQFAFELNINRIKRWDLNSNQMDNYACCMTVMIWMWLANSVCNGQPCSILSYIVGTARCVSRRQKNQKNPKI